MKFAAGWGESLSLRSVSVMETVTPPRLAFRFAPCEPTLPLQGRVKSQRSPDEGSDIRVLAFPHIVRSGGYWLMQFSRRGAGHDAVVTVAQRQHPPGMPRQIIGKLVKPR